MKYPLRIRAIDMVWSEITDAENHVICEVKARYAEQVFSILEKSGKIEKASDDHEHDFKNSLYCHICGMAEF